MVSKFRVQGRRALGFRAERNSGARTVHSGLVNNRVAHYILKNHMVSGTRNPIPRQVFLGLCTDLLRVCCRVQRPGSLTVSFKASPPDFKNSSCPTAFIPYPEYSDSYV